MILGGIQTADETAKSADRDHPAHMCRPILLNTLLTMQPCVGKIYNWSVTVGLELIRGVDKLLVAY